MIYHHFGSKDGLYAEVMREQRAMLGAAWQPVLEQAVTMEPYEGMRLALGGFFDALLARPQVAALLTHEGLGDAPLALSEGVRGLPAPVRSVYERGQADGVFSPGVPFGPAYDVGELPDRNGDLRPPVWRGGRDPTGHRPRKRAAIRSSPRC